MGLYANGYKVSPILTNPPKAKEIATAQGMADFLTDRNEGCLAKYTGTTTADYENGAIYRVMVDHNPEIVTDTGYQYQWVPFTRISPLPSGILGMWKSTNQGANATNSVVKVRVSNSRKLKIYVNSYAEAAADYVCVSDLDEASYPTSMSTSHASTYDFNRYVTPFPDNWRMVEYDLPDLGEHFVWVNFHKDGSIYQFDDEGRVALAINGEVYYQKLVAPRGKKAITDMGETDVYGFATAQVSDGNLISSNIRKNVQILGITGSFEGGGGGGGFNIFLKTTWLATDGLMISLNGGTPFNPFPTYNSVYWECLTNVTKIRISGAEHWGDTYVRAKPHGSSTWTYLSASADYQVTEDIDLEVMSNSCLSADTEITMADGSRRAIKYVKVGDEVLGYTGTQKVRKDEQGAVNISPDRDVWVFEGGYEITTCHRHRFYNMERKAMVYLNEWEIGEHAIAEDGRQVALLKHEHVEEPTKFFSIWTTDDNYYAGGLLAGNRHTKEGIVNG